MHKASVLLESTPRLFKGVEEAESSRYRSSSLPSDVRRMSPKSSPDKETRNLSLLRHDFERIDKCLKNEDSSVDEKLEVLMMFCKDCVTSHLHLQSQIDVLKGENSRLRQKLHKVKEGNAYLEMRLSSVVKELVSRSVTDGLQTTENGVKGNIVDSATKHTLVTLEKQVDRIENELKRGSVDCDLLRNELENLKKIQQESENSSEKIDDMIDNLKVELESKLSRLVDERLSIQDDSDSIKNEITRMNERLEDSTRHFSSTWTLQEASERNPEIIKTGSFFLDLHLLHPSRNRPFSWCVPSYRELKEATEVDKNFLLFSRPFGFEKEGSVRGVLRLALGLVLPSETVQFGVQVLYAPRYKRKFDFSFRVEDQTGGERHIVKVFSSAEVFIPRYWFSQRPSVASGLISFAFLVPVDKLIRDGLLVKDNLKIDLNVPFLEESFSFATEP